MAELVKAFTQLYVVVEKSTLDTKYQELLGQTEKRISHLEKVDTFGKIFEQRPQQRKAQ